MTILIFTLGYIGCSCLAFLAGRESMRENYEKAMDMLDKILKGDGKRRW